MREFQFGYGYEICPNLFKQQYDYFVSLGCFKTIIYIIVFNLTLEVYSPPFYVTRVIGHLVYGCSRNHM